MWLLLLLWGVAVKQLLCLFGVGFPLLGPLGGEAQLRTQTRRLLSRRAELLSNFAQRGVGQRLRKTVQHLIFHCGCRLGAFCSSRRFGHHAPTTPTTVSSTATATASFFLEQRLQRPLKSLYLRLQRGVLAAQTLRDILFANE